jgi:hypothetical protein
MDFSTDGLLGTLISGPIIVDVGEILLGWRPNRGVYFEGGTSLRMTVPLNLELGPVHIVEIAVQLDWGDGVSVTLTVTGDATLGPLYLYLEDTGLILRLVESTDGVLGKYDLAFGLKPPSAYAIALDSPVLKGGGFLAIYDQEYRGALALEFMSFGISAFAILTTQLPSGPGFSFVASLFAQFSVPLGYGFFLTGVGGIIAINRTTDTNALREVLYAGRFDNLLFPADPISSAATILDDLASIFPSREGQYLFGPVVRLGWGQPLVIEGKLGVVLELGQNFRLLILGGLAVTQPSQESPLISLRLSFFGEIDISMGTVSFDATLANSRILTWPVSGDAAIRTGWAPRLEHIASFGGLHPSYPKPSGLPDLRRISINFGDNDPKVTLTAYAAVTLNSRQFGARADLYAKGPNLALVGQTAAEGWLYFDAILYMNPFQFEARMGGGLQLLVDGDLVAGLGFDLQLRGPNPFRIRGDVWATVFGLDVGFEVNRTWGIAESLQPLIANPLQILQQAVQGNSMLEPMRQGHKIEALVFASDEAAAAAVDPAGGARLVQRALPLGIDIQRVGEAQIFGNPKRFDLKVYGPGGGALTVPAASSEFVRSHFWNTSEAEKLRSPAFESHRAGFEIGSAALEADTDSAVVTEYEYEVVKIPIRDKPVAAPEILRKLPVTDLFARRWTRFHQMQVAMPLERYRELPRPSDVLKVREALFVTPRVQRQLAGARNVMEVVSGLAALGNAANLTFSGARVLKPDTRPHANRVVADYVGFSGA